MVNYAPNQLEHLFALAEKNKYVALHIASTIAKLHNDGWTPLHVVIRTHKQGLLKLFDLAEKIRLLHKD